MVLYLTECKSRQCQECLIAPWWLAAVLIINIVVQGHENSCQWTLFLKMVKQSTAERCYRTGVSPHYSQMQRIRLYFGLYVFVCMFLSRVSACLNSRLQQHGVHFTDRLLLKRFFMFMAATFSSFDMNYFTLLCWFDFAVTLIAFDDRRLDLISGRQTQICF